MRPSLLCAWAPHKILHNQFNCQLYASEVEKKKFANGNSMALDHIIWPCAIWIRPRLNARICIETFEHIFTMWCMVFPGFCCIGYNVCMGTFATSYIFLWTYDKYGQRLLWMNERTADYPAVIKVAGHCRGIPFIKMDGVQQQSPHWWPKLWCIVDGCCWTVLWKLLIIVTHFTLSVTPYIVAVKHFI